MLKTNLLYVTLLPLCIWVSVVSGCGSESNTYQSGPIPTPPPLPTIDELIIDLSSQDFYERADAVGMAGLYRDHSQEDKARLIPYLIKALVEPDNDSRVSIRARAADSIGELGVYDEQAIEILILWVNEFNQGIEVEIQAIQTLEVFAEHAQDATPGLMQALIFPNTQLQIAAANTLSAIGDSTAIPYMLSSVLSPNEPFVRKEIGLSLAKYGTEAECAVPYLAPVLDDPELDVAFGAAAVIDNAAGNAFVYHGFEDRLVKATKKWWQETGQYEIWPQCPKGLNGEWVVLPEYTPSTTN